MPKSHADSPPTATPVAVSPAQFTQLPADFLQRLRELQAAYLLESDPIRQSGFSGGPERWRAERSPILHALTRGGSLLDIGCANGHLLECLMEWGAARGIALEPYGVDCSEGLIDLAGRRMPAYASHFFVANAWGWQPPRRFDYVYCVYDCVPAEFLGAFVEQLLSAMLLPRGRLILGAYGNHSRERLPARVDAMLVQHGYAIAGTIAVGTPEIARFAWIDR